MICVKLFFSFLIFCLVSRVFCVDCDSNVSCYDNYTCCRNSSGDWSCCPYRNAVCCPQDNICCRSGYHCSSTGCKSVALERFIGLSEEGERLI